MRTYVRRNKTVAALPQVQSGSEPSRDIIPDLTTYDDKNATTHDGNNSDNLDILIALIKGVLNILFLTLSHMISYQLHVVHLPLPCIYVPQGWRGALADENWKKAMIEEKNALKKNETWESVTLPY